MAGDLDRAHERIDDLMYEQKELEVSQARTDLQIQQTSEQVEKLAKTVEKMLHVTPCPTAQETQRRVEQLEANQKKVSEDTREKARDWRRLALDLVKLATIGVGAAAWAGLIRVLPDIMSLLW